MNAKAIDIPIRKSLCADALISTIHRQFQKIPDPRKFSTKKPASISFTHFAQWQIFHVIFLIPRKQPDWPAKSICISKQNDLKTL
jgi:hypothetical protein